MGGVPCNKDDLNKTLIYITNLLNKYNIKNWFIAYGTLLGIIRNDSCIDKDDDIDILVDKSNFDKIKELLKHNGFEIDYGSDTAGYKIDKKTRNIIKTKTTTNYCSIDFYMTEIKNECNIYDIAENILWENCYINNNYIKYKWNNQILFLPHNSEYNLEKIYGKNWRIPIKKEQVIIQEKINRNIIRKHINSFMPKFKKKF